MLAATDPIYMIQLLQILGNDYVVWDKAVEARYRKPGKSTIYGEFDRLGKWKIVELCCSIYVLPIADSAANPRNSQIETSLQGRDRRRLLRRRLWVTATLRRTPCRHGKVLQ